MRETHTVIINQDDECETDPDENFFSNLVFDTGIQPITVIRPRAEVIIDDSNEPECGRWRAELYVNDVCMHVLCMPISLH